MVSRTPSKRASISSKRSSFSSSSEKRLSSHIPSSPVVLPVKRKSSTRRGKRTHTNSFLSEKNRVLRQLLMSKAKQLPLSVQDQSSAYGLMYDLGIELERSISGAMIETNVLSENGVDITIEALLPPLKSTGTLLINPQRRSSAATTSSKTSTSNSQRFSTTTASPMFSFDESEASLSLTRSGPRRPSNHLLQQRQYSLGSFPGSTLGRTHTLHGSHPPDDEHKLIQTLVTAHPDTYSPLLNALMLEREETSQAQSILLTSTMATETESPVPSSYASSPAGIVPQHGTIGRGNTDLSLSRYPSYQNLSLSRRSMGTMTNGTDSPSRRQSQSTNTSEPIHPRDSVYESLFEDLLSPSSVWSRAGMAQNVLTSTLNRSTLDRESGRGSLFRQRRGKSSSSDQETIDLHFRQSYLNDMEWILSQSTSPIESSTSSESSAIFPTSLDAQFFAKLSQILNMAVSAQDLKSRVQAAEARLRARDTYLQNTIFDTAKRMTEMEQLVSDLENRKEELASSLVACRAECRRLESVLVKVGYGHAVDSERRERDLLESEEDRGRIAGPESIMQFREPSSSRSRTPLSLRVQTSPLVRTVGTQSDLPLSPRGSFEDKDKVDSGKEIDSSSASEAECTSPRQKGFVAQLVNKTRQSHSKSPSRSPTSSAAVITLTKNVSSLMDENATCKQDLTVARRKIEHLEAVARERDALIQELLKGRSTASPRTSRKSLPAAGLGRQSRRMSREEKEHHSNRVSHHSHQVPITPITSPEQKRNSILSSTTTSSMASFSPIEKALPSISPQQNVASIPTNVISNVDKEVKVSSVSLPQAPVRSRMISSKAERILTGDVISMSPSGHMPRPSSRRKAAGPTWSVPPVDTRRSRMSLFPVKQTSPTSPQKATAASTFSAAFAASTSSLGAFVKSKKVASVSVAPLAHGSTVSLPAHLHGSTKRSPPNSVADGSGCLPISVVSSRDSREERRSLSYAASDMDSQSVHFHVPNPQYQIHGTSSHGVSTYARTPAQQELYETQMRLQTQMQQSSQYHHY